MAISKKLKDITSLDFYDLVLIIRNDSDKNKIISDKAFEEIEKRIKVKLTQISSFFSIPGMSFDDIYQESLFALRYKAIKDYDPTRGDGSGPYPFQKFAILCIRRHLSTKLKASYQNKKRALNQSVSLDQARPGKPGEVLYLSDILETGENNILEVLEGNEYYQNLFQKLFKKLSSFEKDVFLLYAHKYSYEEIAKRINVNKRKNKINTKGIDNALSRIKNKAKKIDSSFN